MSSDGLTTDGTEVTRGRLLEVWPHKCVFVVEEIMKTEQDYVASLRQIIEVCCVCVGGGGEGSKVFAVGRGIYCHQRAPPFAYTGGVYVNSMFSLTAIGHTDGGIGVHEHTYTAITVS